MASEVTYRRSGGSSSVSGVVCRGLLCAVLLLSGLACPQASRAAGFELYPKWVRPGPDAVVKVRLPDKIDANRKMFLRLTQAKSAIADLPLAGEQVRRQVVEVRVPGPLRRGFYKAELVSEEGELLASGPNDVMVAAAEKPVITAVLPKVVYPVNGRYDFEIIGDNFSHIDEEKLSIRINDIPLGTINKCTAVASGKLTDQRNDNNLPCLVSDWRAIRLYGLTLDHTGIGRPLEISVEVDKLVSEPKPLVLSYVQRYTPIAIAILVLCAVIALIYFFFIRKMARTLARKTPYPQLACLVIDPQTHTYSLSKLQMIIWAAAAIVAYSYLAASQFLVQWKLGIPNVPQGLPMLLGISATTTALSVGATEFRGSKGAGMVNPGLADFITTGGVFAPERLQFFVWTILGAITFVAATLAQDPGSATEMANIPDTFNQLMGASSLGYLAGKFARKPGPVIKTVTIDDKSGEIRIAGENLSPRGQVLLDGVVLSARIAPASGQTDGDEFVNELIVAPTGQKLAAEQVESLKIKNPDGQAAEWNDFQQPDKPEEKSTLPSQPPLEEANGEKSEEH